MSLSISETTNGDPFQRLRVCKNVKTSLFEMLSTNEFKGIIHPKTQNNLKESKSNNFQFWEN